MTGLVIVAMLSLTIVTTWVLTGLGQPAGAGISARSNYPRAYYATSTPGVNARP